MQSARSPHREIVDPDNAPILATLTRKGWAKINRAKARQAYYGNKLGVDLLESAERSSGTIDGEHRKDLVDALKGQKPASISLGSTEPETRDGRML